MGIVTPLGDPVLHFWLTRSVARSIGLSLTEAMSEGKLTPQGYSEMVTRCRQCPLVSQCQQWLATQGGGCDQVPATCVNAQTLNALKH
ncbi:DUF6455 family protein [Thalassovita aquimarina]|uniref:DUF6455 domain-containing protein n=1 Tax=Thalassovita aquimarina TaxID=2785917 RepID=A0ABS5HQA2_9RHOB|nr:DUF6455 family protein [Thalassovita aquimarina]MBR9650992.1 hypothetical protein [Thalassovita aquimarina]